MFKMKIKVGKSYNIKSNLVENKYIVPIKLLFVLITTQNKNKLLN